MRRLSILAAVAATALTVAAGCGDDDSGDKTSTDPASFSPEKQAFILKAGTICQEGDAKIDEGGQKFAGTGGSQVNQLVRTLIVPGSREELKQIRALTPPPGDEEEVNEFLDAFEKSLVALYATPTDLGDAGPALRSLVEARAMMGDYGLGGCSRGYTTERLETEPTATQPTATQPAQP